MKLLLLQKVFKALKKSFNVEEFMDNALSVSFGRDQMPFCLVIVEEEEPDTIYISFGVDAPDPHSVADVTLRCIHIGKTELAEPFYMNLDGEMFWSQEAYEEYGRGTPLGAGVDPRLEMESPGKLIN